LTEQERAEIRTLLDKMMASLSPKELIVMAHFFDEVSIGLEHATEYHRKRIEAMPKKRSAWDKFEHAITLGWLFE